MNGRPWLALGALVGALLLPATADGLHSGVRSAQGATIVINEVQYDPPPSGSDSGYEWVELLNTGPSAVSLDGWQIADNRSSDDLPPVDLDSGAFVVVAAGDGFAELFPQFAGHVVTVGGSIGNGLGNNGDRVLLLGPDGTAVDGLSYGGDADVFDPPAPDVEAGHILERVPAGTDSDSAGDWVDQSSPSPGAPAGDIRPTDAPTAEPPPTVPPGVAVRLNEYLPAPREVDWDGDGEATADDEWVELFNPGEVEFNLRGWQLDDLADGGSTPYVIPDDTVIAPRGHLLIFKRDSKVALNNGSDSVRLIRPDGAMADETNYRGSSPDTSYARDGDGTGPWTDELPPSPGGPNRTGAPSPVPTDDPGPPPTATPDGGSPVPPASPTPAPSAGPGPTWTPPPAPTTPALFLPYLLTEVLFDAAAPGNDSAHEWVELFNRSDQAVSLAGWALGDRAAWDALPDVVVPPRGFVVVAPSRALASDLLTDGVPVVVIDDGRIGNGLANGGDVVRLRGPTGEIADAVSYGANLDAFDPAVPIGAPGSSIERLPPDQDTDTADDWWLQPAPSPGRSGSRHLGPPQARINEVLPAPLRVDWDGNGSADYTDEWIELHNASGFGADLTGWRLVRGEDDGWTYRFPDGVNIPSGGFRVVYRAESGLALANGGDTVRLERDDGVVADRVTWERTPGYDRSWSRSEDGAGTWTDAYAVTPGGPNRPVDPVTRSDQRDDAPSPDPARATLLEDVRELAPGTRVQVAGRISAPPGVFGRRTAYIGDESGGVMLYLRPRAEQLPALAEGAQVLATGVLKDYHGEREIVLERPADLWFAGEGQPVQPIDVATGGLGESVEGRLVRLRGAVTGWSGPVLTLDDGSGETRVVVRRASGVRRPWVERGQWLIVAGLAGQYARSAPWEGGYRLVPRYARDFGEGDVVDTGPASTLPLGMPNTGRAPTE